MLEIRNLSISYGNHVVIENAHLAFPVGLTCLIGQSGSGKSSILNALVNQIDFQADKYQLGDDDLLKDENFIRQSFAYLVQGQNFISDMTCYENIRLYAMLGNKSVTDDQIKSYLHQVGLDIVTKKSYPDQLSGGERQRLAIAQALAKDSPILLCDEITASLDSDTKHEIFSLLKQLSDEYQKIIILTSHDEDIYEQCDCIYHIEDKQVKLYRNNASNTIQTILYQRSFISIPKQLINTYVSSKVNRQKMMSSLYNIVCALTVSLCAFLVYFTADYLSEQERILDRLCQTQINVIHQTTPLTGNSSYLYEPNLIGFDEEIFEQIQKVDHLESIHPYYWIPLHQFENAAVYGDMPFTITMMYEKKEDIVIERVSNNPFEYSLIRYYPEQEFEKRQTIINPENQTFGVYVNENFLRATGLTEEDLIGATLKITVYPPVTYQETTVDMHIVDTNEYFTILQHEPIGKGIEVELPVLGFVDFWYNEDWAHYFIYTPIAFMEEIRNQVTSQYVLTEDEDPWKPNAYMAFVDDLDNMEKVNLDLRSIDENITTGNKYTDNRMLYEQRSYIENTAIISLSIVLIAGSILSYVYGIYYHQKNADDLIYFKRNGLTLLEHKQILFADCLYQTLMNILFAIPITILITVIGQKTLNMWRFGFISWRSGVIALLVIVFGILQTIISRIYYYRQIKK